MLYMTVFTFEPAHRDEIIKRRMQLGPQLPQGMKLVGEYSYLGSGKVFRLVENTMDDPTKMLEAIAPWTDLGKVEVYPVLEVDKVMEVYAKTAKTFAHV